MGMSNLGFDEALARLIQTSPRELADFHGQLAKRAEEIEKDVEKQFADIKSGDRKFTRPFRP